MRILFTAQHLPEHQALVAALSAAGHEVLSWEPGRAGPDAKLAIVSGLRELDAATDLRCDVLALLEASELEGLSRCTRRPRDFMVKPADAAELVARVASHDALPSRRERTHQRLLASAVDHAHDVIELMDPEGTLEYVNPAYARTFGCQAEAMVGELAPHVAGVTEDSTSTLTKSATAMARGAAWSGVLISRTQGRERRHFDAIITPMKNARGKITHFVAVKRDITERLTSQAQLMEANDALLRAKDAAVTANKAKSDFLANMSHELRTPLNAIIGYSELLAEDLSESEQVTKDLSRIIGAARHLLSLINEVLDLAKIEARKVNISLEDIFVTELVEEAVVEVQPLADRNDNRLSLTFDEAPERMRTDPLRLKQILTNLLSNACKFTERGHVRVEVLATKRSGASWIELRVSDDGIGISKDDQERLFEPFVQAETSNDRRFGGTGLGLAITQRLCEVLGGDVLLKSELGVGSTFTVRLPLEAPASS